MVLFLNFVIFNPIFISALELRHLNCGDVYELSIDDYLKYMETLPFVEQQKIIKQYLQWYFDIGDFEVFTNSIIKRKDFEYRLVVLSPDCQMLAIYDATCFLTIYDFKTKSVPGQINQNLFPTLSVFYQVFL